MEDFTKVEVTVEFKAGETKQPVEVDILNDENSPVFENVEAFDLVLQDARKAIITMPEKAKIIIEDKDDKSMVKDTGNRNYESQSLYFNIRFSNVIRTFDIIVKNCSCLYSLQIIIM